MSDYFNENLLIEDRPLMILPKLAVAVGLNEAVVIQQMYFLQKNPGNGKLIKGYRWIFNTYDQWRVSYFPFWSARTIERIFTSLEKAQIVVSCQPEGGISRRKYYRLNQGVVNLLLKGKIEIPEGSRQIGGIETPECVLPSTETTNRDHSLKSAMTSSCGEAGKGMKLEDIPATWRPDSRTKEQKRRTLRMPPDYPSEVEFEAFLDSEDAGGVINHREGLYKELCHNKWHLWSKDLLKWRRMRNWKETVLALESKISDR